MPSLEPLTTAELISSLIGVAGLSLIFYGLRQMRVTSDTRNRQLDRMEEQSTVQMAALQHVQEESTLQMAALRKLLEEKG